MLILSIIILFGGLCALCRLTCDEIVTKSERRQRAVDRMFKEARNILRLKFCASECVRQHQHHISSQLIVSHSNIFSASLCDSLPARRERETFQKSNRIFICRFHRVKRGKNRTEIYYHVECKETTMICFVATIEFHF